MIKRGDIFRYTAMIGGSVNYYVDEVYENINDEWMVIVSWEDDSDIGWGRTCMGLNEIISILESGHIKMVGTDDYKPITTMRSHKFNPTLRNIPIKTTTKKCPYRTPKLYEW